MVRLMEIRWSLVFLVTMSSVALTRFEVEHVVGVSLWQSITTSILSGHACGSYLPPSPFRPNILICFPLIRIVTEVPLCMMFNESLLIAWGPRDGTALNPNLDFMHQQTQNSSYVLSITLFDSATTAGERSRLALQGHKESTVSSRGSYASITFLPFTTRHANFHVAERLRI